MLSTKSLEQVYADSRRRLEAVENLKETEQQIALLTESLGVSLESLTKRLEFKKLELTSLAEFLLKLNEKADELDQLEVEILGLLKAKLMK